MSWLVVVWTIVTLCLGVYHVSISANCRVFRIALLVSSQIKKYAHVTPIRKQLHWLPVKYSCIFKTATLVYKFLHSSFLLNFLFLSLSSCPYSTRRRQPDWQNHSFAFNALKNLGVWFNVEFPSLKHFKKTCESCFLLFRCVTFNLQK